MSSVLAVAVLVVPASTSARQPEVRPVAVAPDDAALAPYLTQKLTWGPCAPLATTDEERKTFADPRFDCTFLAVPLDYAQPGRQAREDRDDPAEGAATRPHRIGPCSPTPAAPAVRVSTFLPRFACGLPRHRPPAVRPRRLRPARGRRQRPHHRLLHHRRDRRRARPTSTSTRRRPGVAQTESENKDFASAAPIASATTCSPTSAPATSPATCGRATRCSATRSSPTSATPTAPHRHRVRRPVPDRRARARARRRDQPGAGPVESRLTQSRGFQRAFDNFAKECAAHAECPLGSDPPQALGACCRRSSSR